MVRARLTASGLAVLAIVAAGCTKTLDTESVESTFAAAIEEQTGAHVASVECPGDVEAKAGATFECTATGEDQTRVRISVLQEDAEGKVSFDEPLLHTANTEQGLAGELGEGATVDCPDLVLVEPGRPITCTATTPDGEQIVELVPKDDEGDFDIQVGPAS